MSAQPNLPFQSLEEAAELRIRVAEALCALVGSLATAGKIRQARHSMAAVQKILDQTARLVASPSHNAASAHELRACLDELQLRARNAETALKLAE
jgi:hypothetical protein